MLASTNGVVMPRYLLIEFDDNEQADKLRAQIDAATRKGKRFRVVGLFAKPKSFCRCGPETTTAGRGNPKKTHQVGGRFGWLLCTTCEKPSSALSFLKNLVARDDIIDASSFVARSHRTGGPDVTLTHYTYGLTATTANTKG